MNHHHEEALMHTETLATGRHISIAGLAGDDYGRSDDRPALVLMHGLTFDRTTWRDIVPELQRIDPGRRVVALDLPGHGESPELPAYELEDGVDQLHKLVDEAGLDAPVVVGHSAGALLATIYAARHPTRGVVNIDQPLETTAFATLVARSPSGYEDPSSRRSGRCSTAACTSNCCHLPRRTSCGPPAGHANR
jgi:pimeloyl-ACP methyl ester carboxylesterase